MLNKMAVIENHISYWKDLRKSTLEAYTVGMLQQGPYLEQLIADDLEFIDRSAQAPFQWAD